VWLTTTNEVEGNFHNMAKDKQCYMDNGGLPNKKEKKERKG